MQFQFRRSWSVQFLSNALIFAGMMVVMLCLGLTGAKGVNNQIVLTIGGILLVCIFALHLWLVRRHQDMQQRLIRRMCHKMHRLGAARDAAMTASKLRSGYFASTSHEIRTPMNGLLGMIDVLLASPLNEEQQTYAEVMRESCCDLLAMLNDVLDFAKLEAGKLEIEHIPFDLGHVVERAVLLMQPRAQEKGLSLVTELDPALVGSYSGDPARIRQILLNLIGNAIKFTHAGEVRLRVCRPAADGVGTIRFAVADTGIGITSEGQRGLFHEYSQTSASVSRTHGGSGLGLAICRMLTERMGGLIGCDSVVGEGSTFWFTLPLPPACSVADADAAPVADVRSCHILLAEDNKANQIYMRALLAGMGHTLDMVQSGEAAVAAVRGGRYDCVLMDLQMPGMGGLSATRRIRALPSPKNQLPIIGLSADATHEIRLSVRAAGMNDFFVKPVTAAQIQARLAQCVTETRPAAPIMLPVSVPVLDFHQIEDLERVLPQASLIELVSRFLSEAAKFLGDINTAMTAGDLSAAGKLAHQLVSMAGNLGAMEVSMLARRFEQACAAGEREDAEYLSRALSTASAKATAALAARHRADRAASQPRMSVVQK